MLEATVRLVYSHPHRVLLLLGYQDIYHAADHITEVREHRPVGLEGLDDVIVKGELKKGLNTEGLALFPAGGGWLMVEFGGESKDEAEQRARKLMEQLRAGGNPPQMKLITDHRERQLAWDVRESGLGATAYVPGKKLNWEGWEDSAVHPEDLGGYLRELRALMNRYKYAGPMYGHFGDGCVHTRIDFDLFTRDGVRDFRSFIEAAADLVVKYRGSFSGEHGDGQSRGELLPKMFGEELMQAFREFKSIWDPEWKMNPGKVIDANPIDSNLKFGPDYRPAQPTTHFQFADDRGSFAHATLRCVGVGKCRRMESGTMCPSFMVTREEKHTTRGRARLLWEMIRGETITDGWQSEEVKEALDLCLSCKGCKGDCPVNVDVATYKAEFLSHYYEHNWRPIQAWAFGFIFHWARLASLAPSIANFFSQTPGLRSIAKLLAGMPQQRQIPAFAPQTFKQWFFTRHQKPRSAIRNPRSQVLLWPDTFNNHFHPDIPRAAVEVLEHAGFQVHVPKMFLCCGRPLYDFGLLDQAKHQLRRILEELRPQIRNDIPVVVLEPSCASVFCDELVNFFPEDEDALRLRSLTYTFSQFLRQKAPHLRIPGMRGRALLHGHCHQKALAPMTPEMKVLRSLGLNTVLLDSGCCGMAGPFGFEKEHYEVSVACGERALLPQVRQADEEAIIVADGFSCQQQIEQLTDRYALHVAQVVQMALWNEQIQLTVRPEEQVLQKRRLEQRRSNLRTGAFIAAGVLIGAAWSLVRSSDHR
jgi:Fe-S oxidoreductase